MGADAAMEFIRQHPERTLGPWLCGGLLEFLLLGALIAMVSEYWERYGDLDGWKLKSTVWLMLVLNILRSGQCFTMLWHKLIAGFGDYLAAATSTPWYAQVDPLTTSIIALLVQGFFAARLHRLAGGLRWLLIPLVLSMALALGGHIGVTYQLHHLKTVSDIAVATKTMYAALCGLMASDVIICVALSHVLYRSRTGFKRTDSLISRLLHVTWMTATLPAICELIDLVLYKVKIDTGNSAFMVFHFMGPKLYSLSMMYTLNARQGLRSRDQTYPLSSVGIPSGRGIEVNREVLQFEDGRRPHDGTMSLKFSDAAQTDVTHLSMKGRHETDTIKVHPVA